MSEQRYINRLFDGIVEFTLKSKLTLSSSLTMGRGH